MQGKLLKKKKSSCSVITLQNEVKHTSSPFSPPAPPPPSALITGIHLIIMLAIFAAQVSCRLC